MLKRLTQTGLIVLTMAFSQAAVADEVLERNVFNKTVRIPLPEGFCDITDTVRGQLIRAWVEPTVAGSLVIQSIFVDCDLVPTVETAEDMYPWGYLATLAQPEVVPEQQRLNELMRSTAAQTMIQEHIEDGYEALDSTADSFGMELEAVPMGQMAETWADDGIWIGSLRSNVNLNGEHWIETANYAVSTTTKRYLFYYMYAEDKIDIRRNIDALVDVGQEIRRLN